jgi:hypothetical protein
MRRQQGVWNDRATLRTINPDLGGTLGRHTNLLSVED